MDELLKKYDYYYTIGQPLVSDAEYDKLREEFYKKEPKNKYFKLIGSDTNFNQSKLKFYLGSQTKIKTDKALQNWLKKYKTNNYLISEKLDGISALYLVKENKLYTRGNGKIGSDISHILEYINLPEFTTNINYVRGELIISKENWNQEYGSNARNVVAGLVNSKTVNQKLLNLVDLVIYQVIDNNQNLEEQLRLVKKNCVKYNLTKELIFKDLQDTLIDYKQKSEYEIDGIVITDNSVSYDNIESGNPDFSFAFKMEELDQSIQTTVTDVEYKLSKDRRYKPRVLFNQVTLDQVNIQCATGYNLKFIIDNGIGIGSEIEIKRSGQVIPKIIRVIKQTEPILPKGNWKWDETNTDAISQDIDISKEENISISVHFFKTLNIKNISDGIITKLYDNGFQTLDSILLINNKDQLINIDGIGDKKIELILTQIKEVLKYDRLEDIMAGSNIFERSLGVKKLKLIIQNFPNILHEDISIESLITINGIGKINAEQFITGIDQFRIFYNKHFQIPQQKTVSKEKTVPKEKTLVEQKNILHQKLINKKVVFTGIRDKKLELLIEENGGKVSSTVSKNTDLVITKDLNLNSSTIKKANELKIEILEYDKIKND
jgi:NAD-dependent DNA ligase